VWCSRFRSWRSLKHFTTQSEPPSCRAGAVLAFIALGHSGGRSVSPRGQGHSESSAGLHLRIEVGEKMRPIEFGPQSELIRSRRVAPDAMAPTPSQSSKLGRPKISQFWRQPRSRGGVVWKVPLLSLRRSAREVGQVGLVSPSSWVGNVDITQHDESGRRNRDRYAWAGGIHGRAGAIGGATGFVAHAKEPVDALIIPPTTTGIAEFGGGAWRADHARPDSAFASGCLRPAPADR